MTDYRRTWIGEHFCGHFSMDTTGIFNNMFQFDDEDLEDQFTSTNMI